MSQLNKYLDLFTVEQYPAGENGLSEVPLADVYAAMRDLFPRGYRWQAVSAGFSASGRPYFVGNLTVTDEDGLDHTVPGSADAPPEFGLAGVASMAFKNACLRGLGMGDALYRNRPEPAVESSNHNVSNTPPSHYTSSGSTQTYDGSRSNNGNYGPWTGAAKVKNGEFAGTPYNRMPGDVLEKWAASGVVVAQKELDRRRTGGEGSDSAQSAVRRSPWAGR